jgi:hypothetical protein
MPTPKKRIPRFVLGFPVLLALVALMLVQYGIVDAQQIPNRSPFGGSNSAVTDTAVEEIATRIGPGDCVMLFHQRDSINESQRKTYYYFYNTCERAVTCKMRSFDYYTDDADEKQRVEDETVFVLPAMELKEITTACDFNELDGDWFRYSNTNYPISHPIDDPINSWSLMGSPLGAMIWQYQNIQWEAAGISESDRLSMNTPELKSRVIDASAQMKLMPCEWVTN